MMGSNFLTGGLNWIINIVNLIPAFLRLNNSTTMDLKTRSNFVLVNLFVKESSAACSDRQRFKRWSFGGNFIHWVVSCLEKKVSEALIQGLESFLWVESSHIDITRTINREINLTAFYEDIMCERGHNALGYTILCKLMSNTKYSTK